MASYESNLNDEAQKASFSLLETGRFIWKHKNKLVVGAVVISAGYGIYRYYTDKSSEKMDDISSNPADQLTPISDTGILMKPANRTRMLLRIRKQFDIAIKQFLPTMRLKVLEVVDVSSAIRKIKELRAISTNQGVMNTENSQSAITEEMLWEEIKVSTLTLLYVSCYMLSAVTVLLRVQLHILGKSYHTITQITQTVSDDMNEIENNLGGDVFKILIEGTYKPVGQSKYCKNFAGINGISVYKKSK